MKKYLKYDLENTKIIQNVYSRQRTAKSESIMALGNGYLGLRTADEENTSSNKTDLFVNGVFNQADDKMVSELANLADLTGTVIYINDHVYIVKDGLTEYNKELDINTGSVKRVIHFTKPERELRFTFERFVSQTNENVYGQKITLELLSGEEAKITIFPMINGQTTNGGTQHLKEGEKRRPTLESVQYIEETNQSGRTVIHNLVLKAIENGNELKGGNDDYIVTMERRRIGFKINSKINVNEPFILEKLMSVNTSIDNEDGNLSVEDVQKKANELHDELLTTSYDAEFEKSSKEWVNIHNQFDVQIKGDNEEAKYDALALKFALFHQNSFVPKKNTNLSVGAKGLSGEGYQGHSFWDTEFFINPNYLFTQPEIAKQLLTYRYKGINGARAKAMEDKVRPEESKLNGAQFPWEMAWPTDGEVCPYWGQADVVTGKQEPIASRRQEIHVPADIAYAVHQYYTFTDDKQFIRDMGLEIIIDTAVFWSNRAELQSDGTFEINDVMGPNEYKGNINNNAYINRFAKLNLDLAIRYRDEWDKAEVNAAISKIPYEVDWAKIELVSEKLVQQKSNVDGVIAENDQFMGLSRMDVTPFQLLGDAGKKLFNTSEGHKRLSSQLVKQADVVLLTYLLPQFYTKDEIEANFNFYEPITTHDSSLSPTTYAIQAIDLRQMELAYKLFKYSLTIDMGPNMYSSNAGIHSGALSATWQTIVFGYGGLRWANDEINIKPVLPEQWDGLDYKVQYKGVWLQVSVGRDKFTVKTVNEKDTIDVKVNDVVATLTKDAKEFEVIKTW